MHGVISFHMTLNDFCFHALYNEIYFIHFIAHYISSLCMSSS